jgi:hypothetical protein
MARLVSVTAYAKDSTAYSSASPLALNADNIKFVTNASTSLRQKFPAASGSINSVIMVNDESSNAGQDHEYIVAETISALVTASA